MALAGDGIHLVITVQVVLVGAIAKVYTFDRLIGYVRIANRSEKNGKPVQAGEVAVLHGVAST